MEDYTFSKPFQGEMNYVVMGGATLMRSNSARRLDVRGCSIGKIPEEMAEMPNLEILLLTENEITEELLLAFNYLTTLPPAIKYLTQLTALNLFNNKLAAIPQEITFCSALKLLVLSRNKFTHFPDLGTLTNLEDLELADNRISSVPNSCLTLQSLQILNLQGNKIKSLPNDIGQLHSLTKLNIRGNKLTSLPSSITSLTRLLFLNVRENLLERLPYDIDGLVSLVDLDITENNILCLPSRLGWMKSLKNLRFAENPLEDPPKEIMAQSCEAIMAYLRQHEPPERKKSLIMQKIQNVRENLGMRRKLSHQRSSSEKDEVVSPSTSPPEHAPISPSTSPPEHSHISSSTSPPGHLPSFWKKITPHKDDEELSKSLPPREIELGSTRGKFIGNRDKSNSYSGENTPKFISRKSSNTYSENFENSNSNSPSRELNETVENKEFDKGFEQIISTDEEADCVEDVLLFIKAEKPASKQFSFLQSYRTPGFKPIDESKFPRWWKSEVKLKCTAPCTCSTYSSESRAFPTDCKNCGHEALSHIEVENLSTPTPVEDNFSLEVSFQLNFILTCQFVPWLINSDELKFTSLLGTGQSAKVYKGTYRGQEVALKVLKNSPDGKQWSNFKKELDILSSVRSPYLVYFFGAVLKPKVCIVLEYCALGTLQHVLKNLDHVITWERAIELCQSITQGVSCLHSWKPPIVHRDLKSLNMLVTSTFVVKLGDFGLSRRVNSKNMSSLGKMRGTYAYCAPEIYFGSNFTVKSDIYSLGVVFWEIFNRIMKNKYEVPYEDHPELQIEFKVIMWVAQKGVRPTLPPNLPSVVAELLKLCWEDEPEKRPTCEIILEKLDQLDKEFHKNTKKWNTWLRNKS